MTLYNIVDPSSMVTGQPEDVSQVLANFQAIQAVLNGNIDNSNITNGAAIASSKLAGYPWHNADIATAAAIAYSKLVLTGSVVNADIANAAAIASSKLAGYPWKNADIDPAAAIAYSKLALAGGIVNADVNAAAAIALSKLGTPFATVAMTTPADPTGTSSATAVMMGLSAGTTVITPKSTRLYVCVAGTFIGGTGVGGPGNTCKLNLRYGTGNGPANGAAVAGTLVGNGQRSATTLRVPFAVSGVITGLTPATAVWVDLDLAADGTNTANLIGITLSAFDLT